MPPTNYKWNSSSYLKNNLSTGLILLIFIQLWYLIPKSGFVSSNWILDNIKDFFFHFYSLNGWSISSVTKSEFGDDSNDSKDSQHLAERIGRGAGQKVLSFLGFFSPTLWQREMSATLRNPGATFILPLFLPSQKTLVRFPLPLPPHLRRKYDSPFAKSENGDLSPRRVVLFCTDFGQVSYLLPCTQQLAKFALFHNITR